jgi:hypothetical protein
MKPIVRSIALVVAVALSLSFAPRVVSAGTPTAKTCYFLRNNLPCPCPNGPQARAVARAAVITAGAIARAAVRTEHKPVASAQHSTAKPAPQPTKR